jgi:hypothetical protein
MEKVAKRQKKLELAGRASSSADKHLKEASATISCSSMLLSADLWAVPAALAALLGCAVWCTSRSLRCVLPTAGEVTCIANAGLSVVWTGVRQGDKGSLYVWDFSSLGN